MMIKMINKNSRKGFFFVFIVFLIISYILVSISLTVNEININEKRFAERFKNSNIELAMNHISDEKIDKLSRLAVYNALFNLNSYSIDHPLKRGSLASEEEQLVNVRGAMNELVEKGTASGSYFDDGSGFSIGKEASLSGWVDSLNETLGSIGFQVTSFYLDNFWLNQSSRENVDYSFTIHIEVEEKGGLASVERDYLVLGSVPVQGFTDPALDREVKIVNPGLDVQKQFYFNVNYSDPASVKPGSSTDPSLNHPGTALETTSEGQGWFYGYVIDALDPYVINLQPFEQKKYILVGAYDDIVKLDDLAGVNYHNFGAYILTNDVQHYGSCSAEDKTFNAIIYPEGCGKPQVNPDTKSNVKGTPFVVAPGFSVSEAPECDAGHQCVLFVNRHSPEDVASNPTYKLSSGAIYNIEHMRDAVACNYYITNTKSPSYLQRLLVDSYTLNSTYGLESFVMGDFIGGHIDSQGNAITPVYDSRLSRLDREFVKGDDGITVRGMPGCKYEAQCTDPSLLGHFGMGPDSLKAYGTDAIACNDGRAECTS